jgi:hypothetical protein
MPRELPPSSEDATGVPPGAALPAKPAQPETLEELTDGRPHWQWRSKYAFGAWISIAIEGAYLVVVPAVALACLVHVTIALLAPASAAAQFWIGTYGVPPDVLLWATVALGGACGGCAFALKWLYHGVAHGKWHRDRLVWRLVVPILSGVLALFASLMVGSGILPVFDRDMLNGPKVGAAFGFFVGFFSDNLLAGLQRLATQVLGTLEKQEPIDRS